MQAVVSRRLPADFVEILEPATMGNQEARPDTLAELVFCQRPNEDPDAPIVLGTVESRALEISLRTLRSVALQLIEKLENLGLRPGDTVCLLRLPRTSETLVAVTYVAASAFGLRVLLPMFVEPDRFLDWVERSHARAVIWAAQELRARGNHEADCALLDGLASAALTRNLLVLDLDADLHVAESLAQPPKDIPHGEERVARMRDTTSSETECLLLTTSGTSGRSKLVLYRQAAFLASCAAFEQAGLFRDHALGGRGLCLLLCHSMGIRSLWNALWTRSPLCLIPPEWFEEHPERVRALLLQMRPEHVTGGPAVFRTLLELARVFPQLKEQCLRDLKCVVSSGAPFDPQLCSRLRSTLGLHLHNALGLTETQQVATTLTCDTEPQDPRTLGNPLPGVRLGLARPADAQPGVFRLFVSSPFAHAGILADDGSLIAHAPGDWFDTGDLVTLDHGALVHAGREALDFFKDGFGVKISRSRVLDLYAALGEPVVHVEPFALRDEPGLAAVVFVHADAAPEASPESPVTSREIVRRVRSLLEGRLEQLRRQLEEMEFRHLTIIRFVCIAAEPPRTPKGPVSRAAVQSRHAPLIQALTAELVREPGFDSIERRSWNRTSTVRVASPRRGELLRVARLDKDFVAGQGDVLTYREHGRDHDVLDFVGGFGGNLLGHRNPDVLQAAQEFLASPSPCIGEQGSASRWQGELARRLALAVGRFTGDAYVVRFGSTGSEVVEMALAHAFIERSEQVRKFYVLQQQQFGSSHPHETRSCIDRAQELLRCSPPRVLAMQGAFHGHSLAARSLLGDANRRVPYAPMSRIEPIFLAPDGDSALDEVLLREVLELPYLEREGDRVRECVHPISNIFAAIAEPILGEGGVTEIDPRLLDRLSKLPFPLIIDEIQCGLGRSGTFLASEGVRGHYYLFAKSIGGGVAKLSALLIDRERYVPRFDEHYASTFAGDPFSCFIGCRVLDLIQREDIPARARERGTSVRATLERVCSAYPQVIRRVRGRGLMLGIELDPACAQRSVLLRALARHEDLGVLAAAYLLNVHGIRVLPTLSAPNILRIAPSAFVRDDQIAALEKGLIALCDALASGRIAELMRHLVADEADSLQSEQQELAGAPIPIAIEPPAPTAARIGFVNHFVYPEREIALAEPDLATLSLTERRALFHRLMEVLELRPIIAFAKNVLHQRVWFLSVANAVDIATLEAMHRSRDRRLAVERVQESVDLAAREGCSIVALGAYSSIITRNGKAIVAPAGVRITSGNTFTVAVAYHRIVEACDRAGFALDAPDTRIGIVGATGNIGSALCHRLLHGPRSFRNAVLVSRSFPKLTALANSLTLANRHCSIDLSDDLTALRSCNVIALAVNTNAPLLYPHHLGPQRPLIIGDVSVPGSVSQSVRRIDGVRVLPIAGVIALPGEPGFVMSSHSPPGTAFCCAAEAMLLGLEPDAARSLPLIGDVDPLAVQALEQLAYAHGMLEPLR